MRKVGVLLHLWDDDCFLSTWCQPGERNCVPCSCSRRRSKRLNDGLNLIIVHGWQWQAAIDILCKTDNHLWTAGQLFVPPTKRQEGIHTKQAESFRLNKLATLTLLLCIVLNFDWPIKPLLSYAELLDLEYSGKVVNVHMKISSTVPCRSNVYKPGCKRPKFDIYGSTCSL